MHRAVEHNTKYFRVDPIQYILLRRGSQWRPMVTKIAVCLLGLFFTSNASAKGLIENADKHFVESFFLLMASYSIVTNSLYFISYPLGERLTELPVKMAYFLLRLLVGFFLVSCIVLYDGISIEFNEIDADKAEAAEYRKESFNLRAARILCTLSLIIWVIYMSITLYHLCYLSGIDGTRVHRPKAFKKFRKI